jgi:cytochrome bd-type quinol oxidase subunit 2
MKYLSLVLLATGCSTIPVVVADTTRPSVMEETIKNGMVNSVDPSYLWVLWYIPIVVVVLSWAWKTFFSKEKNESKTIS